MDNNLLGITTLAQKTSKTPLITGDKKQQLMNDIKAQNMNSDQQLANNMSQTQLEKMSTMDYNNSRRSPFRSTHKNGYGDESNDNISSSNYDQTTLFGSPGLNKSYDKTAKSKLVPLASQNNQQQPNNGPSNVVRQSSNLSYQSPDKMRRGSNAKSGRSNSSRGESSDRGHQHRHGSAARNHNRGSASRGRSYSGTDQDSQEKSFTYPCQAFKQFLLAVREGKIDMKDLNNSPFLIDYLTMQAQIGGQGSNGGTGGGGDKAFANSLRSSTASNRSGSKNRDHSRSNKKQRPSHLGESLKAPRDSIIEEEEDDNGQTGTHAKQHNFNPRNSSAHNKKPVTQNTSSQLKNQSPLKQPRVSQVQNNTQPNLLKHNFKEDNKNPSSQQRTQNNQSPMKSSNLQQNAQQSAEKKPRRGRNDRSTSGDERAGGKDKGDSSDGGVIDLRFDDKGRPIKNSIAKPKHQFNSNQKPGNKPGANNNDSEDDQLTNDYNSNNMDANDAKKRRRRGDRDSSVGGSSVEGNNNKLNNRRTNSKSNSKNRKDNNGNLTLSPNEPRSISKLPKPTIRDDQPQITRQSQNNLNGSSVMLPPISERLNTNGDGGEDGTFRDNGTSNMSQSHRTGGAADSSRLPIFDKNTDFKTDADYSLNALKDNTTKKYLKSTKSPLKKTQFREDEDDNTNTNVINLNDDMEDIDDNDKIQTFNDNSSINDRQSDTHKYNNNNNNDDGEEVKQNSDGGYYKNYQEPSIAVYQRKTPLRENRKVNSSNVIVNNSNKNNTPLVGGAVIYDEIGNSMGNGGDDLQGQDVESMKFREQMESQNMGSPMKGMGDRSRSNLSNNNMQNSQGSMLQNLNDYQNQQYNSAIVNRSPNNDRPMTRDDLEGSGNDYDRNYQSGNDNNNQQSANKKRRRDRASRGGNQSSDVSMDRQQPIEARHFNNSSRNNQLGNSQSMEISNKSPSKSNKNEHQLTIEEHLDTYRSKTSSQVNLTMKSGRSQYKQDDDNEDQEEEFDNNNDNDNYDKSGRVSNYNKSQQSPMKSVKSRRSNNQQQQYNNNTSTNKSRDQINRNDNNLDDDYENDDFNERTQYNNNQDNKSNRHNSSNNVGAGANTNKSSPSKKRYHEDNTRSNKNNNNNDDAFNEDQDQDVYDQDRSQNSSRQQDSSRYHDDYNNQLGSNRKDNPSERKRENRRSNANNNTSNHNINYDNNSNGNGGNSRNNLNNNNNDSNNNMRQSQKSLTNLANTNYDEYNYSSFGQQQQQQQPGDNNNDVYDSNNNNNSTGKKPRRKRGSRERSSDIKDNNSNNNDSSTYEDQVRSSQIKKSMVPLRNNRQQQQYASQNDQYKTNYSSTGYQNHNTNNGNIINEEEKKLKKYQSRLKELEDKLKKQVQENPSKPLDYKLIQEINDEAARTIQMQFRLKKLQKKQKEDAGLKHGNLVDRMVQTEPINLYSLGMKSQAGISKNGQFDMDKFKRFFFAVFYTYMMMNTIMADVFKRQQPMQTNNQWNEQDYKDYMQNRQNNNNKK